MIAPLALGLPGKAAAGQRMMNGFQPIMQPDQVATTARYYNDVFVPLGTVTPTMSAQNLAKFQAYLKGFGGMRTDAAKLVPLLAHYEPLVTTMQANVDNYKQVNSLPDFRLFTVFFVVPGALLILLAGYGLFGSSLRGRIAFHHHARPTHA